MKRWNEGERENDKLTDTKRGERGKISQWEATGKHSTRYAEKMRDLGESGSRFQALLMGVVATQEVSQPPWPLARLQSCVSFMLGGQTACCHLFWVE